MGNVSSVSGTNGLQGPSLDPNMGFDAEVLLNYCTEQLNDINGDIKQKLAAQQTGRDAKAYFNDARSKLTNGGQTTDILTSWAKGIDKMPPGPDRDAAIIQLNAYRATSCWNDAGPPQPITNENIQVYANGGGDGKGPSVAKDIANPTSDKNNNFVDGEEKKKFAEGIGTTTESIGKNMELEMIGLQQCISQRGMAIQITTQMMQKLQQAIEAIIQGIGK
jgi:hypothetical protein